VKGTMLSVELKRLRKRCLLPRGTKNSWK